VSDGADAVPARPAPEPSELTAGFWKAAAEGALVVQRCDHCGRLRHYPQPMCPHCHSLDWSWSPVSGRGTIYSFTITHRAFHPAFVGAVPYALIDVELEEGLRMLSDVPTEELDSVAIGQPVEVYFVERDGITFPRFRVTVA
jgi:uncharacterized OB-fold protein